MFAYACTTATAFTRPLIICKRYFDGSVASGYGTFVVVNDEGWIVTAAHLLSSYERVRRDADEIIEYYSAIGTIEREEGVPREKKFEKIRELRDNPKWIINLSYWWGMDGVTLSDIRFLPEGDLAVGRLQPFDPHACAAYPVFKSPDDLRVGTALCKLGFPLQRVPVMFREANNSFEIGSSVRTMFCFPMEGLYTRTLYAGKSGDGRYEIKFLETSSPALKGQSGGPILDANGFVWGILSRTDHHAYGSISREERDGIKEEENQFINLGIGIHSGLLLHFLEDNGIRFLLSDDLSAAG